MEATRKFLDELFRSRIRHARQVDPAQRFMDGLAHCDAILEWTKAGIRHQFPDADEAKVQQILCDRIERLRRRNRR